jgi:amino acid adenylation domain-containing protein
MNVPRGSTPGSARQEPSGAGSRIRPRNPFVEFRAEETGQSIPARFAQQVAAYPNRAAVVTRQHRLTYDELNQAANRVAHAILAQRGEGNETCAFLLGSGAATAAGMLGILKAGKILVGLERASPLARSAYILEHSQAGSMVTDDDNQSLARELAASRIPVINIDRFAHEVSSDDVELSIAPEALAAVAYTSGSTGQPKGVIQSHYNFLYAQRVSTNRLHVAKEDRAVTLFSLAFMGGITTNLRYLLNGACLCPFDIRREGMHALAGWLTQERATVLVANPTTFRHFVGTLKGDEDFSTLRLLLIGGEVLYPHDVELFKKHFAPDCLLANALGSSEMTQVCVHLMDKETQIRTSVVPVGYEYPDLQVLLWDEEQRDVGTNRVGQIVIRSRYLSPGYWRQPDLTRATFLPDPEGGDQRLYRMGDLGLRLADGCIVHLGREDQQVKIRGYRVEIAEVETALMALDGISEAVVVAREDGLGEKRLVAYVVPAGQSKPTVSALRRALAERLPEYMIPWTFAVMESLPLGATSKVDRQALPEPAPTRPELANPFVAPRTKAEARLAKIWEEVLGIQPIGVRDSFLDLGGDSLTYFSLLLRVEEEFGRPLPGSAALGAQTVERMAAVPGQAPRPWALILDSVRVRGYAEYLARRLQWLRSPRALLGGGWRVLEKNAGRAAAALGGAVLSYRIGSRVVSWISGQRWLWWTVFRRQLRVLRQCLACAPPAPITESEVVRLSIASNLWSRWRCRALSRLTDREFEEWVSVAGLPAFGEAFKAGRGVVLVQSHTAPLRVVKDVLRRAGFDVAFTVGADYALQEVYGSSLRGSQLYDARQILRRGGIVRVVGDGEVGTSAGIAVPFFGRERTFRAGFAELAVTTEAAVVPASVSMNLAGHLDVRLFPPLETSEADRHLRIESLLLQYVDILRREWTEHLASFKWKHLELFLRLSPPVNQLQAPPATAQSGG